MVPMSRIDGEELLPREILLIRSMRADLARHVIPDLRDVTAIEHAELGRLVLDRLANDWAAELVGDVLIDREIANLIADIDRVLDCSDAPMPTTTQHLRELLVTRLRELSTLGAAHPDRDAALGPVGRTVVALERRLRESRDRHRAVDRDVKPIDRCDVTAPRLTEYLRAHLPDAPALEVTGLRALSGGGSKITMFVTLAGHPAITEAVLRQDMLTGVVDTQRGATRVADEYPVLREVHAAGLPVAEPLWLEPERTALGPSFMLTRRVKGIAPGSWRGFQDPKDPSVVAAVKHLAEVLGQLHSLAPESLLPPGERVVATEDYMQREIEYRWAKWQQNAVEPSPLVECAFARLRRECRQGLGRPVLVHGDVLPHNLLIDEGRVTALLDWEFAHIGDPAEDLAYLQPAVPAVLPWRDFMELYLAAGGQPVDDRRLAIFGLYGLVRNCSFLASASRLHVSGKTEDFTKDAIGYVFLPAVEAQIAALLEAMD